MDLKNKYNDSIVRKGLDVRYDAAVRAYVPISGAGRVYSEEDWEVIPTLVWNNVALSVSFSHRSPKSEKRVYIIHGFDAGNQMLEVGEDEKLVEENGCVRLQSSSEGTP